MEEHLGYEKHMWGTSVNSQNSNTSSASGVVANGGAVAQKSYSLSYSNILGYGRPYYGDETTVTTTDSNGCPYGTSTATVKYGSKGTHVYRCQWYLNEANNAGLDLDGDCGSKSEAAIKAFQAAKKLEVDGKCGPITWAELEQTVAELKNPIVIEEVEEVFTQQEFNTMMETYLLELSNKEVSGWAETIWNNMQARGVFDGTEPQMYTTREQLAKTLSLLGDNAFAYYSNVSDCPGWMKPEVQAMIDDEFLKGTDENTNVGKYHYQLEAMIVAYRMYLKAVGR